MPGRVLETMTTEHITDAEITDYLLGVGDDARSEIIEELTFTQDGFAERVDAVENDMVDSYTAGGLGDSERERFDSHYLATNRRRDKLAFAQTFREFPELPQARASPADSSKTTVQKTGWWPGIFGWRPAIQVSFAALAIAFFAAVWWLARGDSAPDIAVNGTFTSPAVNGTNTQPPVSPDSSPVPTPSADVAVIDEPPVSEVNSENRANGREPVRPGKIEPRRLPRVLAVTLSPPIRGGEPRAVAVAANVERVAFTLELESTDFRSYSVELNEQSGGRTIWRQGTVRPRSTDGSRRINLSVPGKLLKPQIYRFTVSGVPEKGSAEIIGDYAFRVVQ